MPTALTTSRKTKQSGLNKESKPVVSVMDSYDVAADSKSRISLRRARTKYFHVKALSNGSYVLEPRVLVSPEELSPRTREMMEASIANFKKGTVSKPIDLTGFELNS